MGRIKMGILLELRNLTKKYGGLTAVNDFSVEIRRGELVGLIGPNGAGKTTIFTLISGFEKPNSGRIFFDSINITGKQPYQIVNLGITRTFQIVRSFNGLSLLDNVSVSGLSPRGRRASKKMGLNALSSTLLASVGLIDKARVPPFILPHGDLRRLEIAKALGSNPELLLLDEPFSGLSHEESVGLTELIKKLHSDGATIFMTGHVLHELMTLVPRVIAMDRGRLIDDGPPQAVADNKIVREVYLGKNEGFT
jgi:branched-chain amino acid transport system ATP-binding protein